MMVKRVLLHRVADLGNEANSIERPEDDPGFSLDHLICEIGVV